MQIADELQRAGKKVWLSVGAHDRPPRRYRQRDFCWWLGVLGLWEASVKQPGKEHVTIAVSGARGGHTVDFRQLAHRGITLVGQTTELNHGKALFGDDLQENIRRGDESYPSCWTLQMPTLPAMVLNYLKNQKPVISCQIRNA